MSLPINGQRFAVPGVKTRCYLDAGDPCRPPRTPKCYRAPDPRVQPLLGIVWHTVHGTADGTVVDEPALCQDESDAMAYARAFARHGGRDASAHLIVADSGVVLGVADLAADRTWHAGRFNNFTIGIELDQEGPRGLCAPLLKAAVDLAWWLSETFGIQPMIPARTVDGVLEPDLRDLSRLLASPDGARSFRGHFFHANCPERGEGDPGPALGRALLASGFEGLDVAADEDLHAWRARQEALGMPPADCDGIPGPRTRAALEKAGRLHGLWATRVP